MDADAFDLTFEAALQSIAGADEFSGVDPWLAALTGRWSRARVGLHGHAFRVVVFPFVRQFAAGHSRGCVAGDDGVVQQPCDGVWFDGCVCDCAFSQRSARHTGHELRAVRHRA